MLPDVRILQFMLGKGKAVWSYRILQVGPTSKSLKAVGLFYLAGTLQDLRKKKVFPNTCY